MRAFNFDVIDLKGSQRLDGDDGVPKDSRMVVPEKIWRHRSLRLGICGFNSKIVRQNVADVVDFKSRRLTMKKNGDLIDQYIWVDADRCHGKPCFKGTRIMVYLVLEKLEEGASYEEIRKGYPSLTRNHIKAALHYAAKVLEKREFDPSFLKDRDVLSTR